jgi:protein gp37
VASQPEDRVSNNSAIEWTDATWNPVTGCTKVSPGCAHCYIERTPAFRIAGRRFVKGSTDVQIHKDRLDQPLRWRKPRRIFVNSLSDLFHDRVSFPFALRVFQTMQAARQHVFQVLTKRPVRMLEFMRWMEAEFIESTDTWPLPNVWLGVSVENQHFADERIPLLLQTPAAVRFVSAEPLLTAVDLRFALSVPTHSRWRTSRLDWVIVGGESGPGARPFNVEWARSIVAQCRDAAVPVFVKQLGSNAHIADEWRGRYTTDISLRDRKGGDPDEWPEGLRVRQFPEARA